MTFFRFLNYYYCYYVLCFCTVSPAGAVAGVTTAPAPVGNSRPTALARSRDSRNCFSPTHPFTPQHTPTELVLASSGQILHFTFKPLTFLRQNGRNFRVTFHSPVLFCFVLCVCVCVCVWERERERERCMGSSHKDCSVVYITGTVHQISLG